MQAGSGSGPNGVEPSLGLGLSQQDITMAKSPQKTVDHKAAAAISEVKVARRTAQKNLEAMEGVNIVPSAVNNFCKNAFNSAKPGRDLEFSECVFDESDEESIEELESLAVKELWGYVRRIYDEDNVVIRRRKGIIIVLKLEILQTECAIIGSPKNYEAQNLEKVQDPNLLAIAAQKNSGIYSGVPGMQGSSVAPRVEQASNNLSYGVPYNGAQGIGQTVEPDHNNGRTLVPDHNNMFT
ncbi:hypothetical protein C2845_PM11G04730 [Panicum miliaceum]|uniref:Uncharacterized protein n=1 Tax=Panicum miliaceum TaxID=4540 RepID=A0A3L6RUD9_PANMI|nr:hypothetical protein C2845_PM11G04730 [Panicum miliaceum]